MKTLIFSLLIFLLAPSLQAQERYRSRSSYGSDRADSSSSRRYESRYEGRSSYDSGSRADRYRSKSPSERQRFDNNLNRYNNYSPQEKRQAQEKWRNFKQETSPAERRYIREKLREEGRRRR